MAAIIWDLRQPDSRRWKGIATGLAAGIKLTPLVFIPYLLLTRKWWAAAVTTGSFVFTIVLGFLILPRDSKDWWFNGLFIQDGRTGFVGWTGNQSLRAIATRLAGSINAGTVPWVILALIATVVGLLVAAQLDRAGHAMLGLLTAALVGLLDSPISWDHHWVWVVPGHDGGRALRGPRLAGGQAPRRLLAARPDRRAAADLRALAGQPVGRPQHGSRQLHPGPDLGRPLHSGHEVHRSIGDLPWFQEYHWTGLQDLAGNAYILAGIALLVLLTVVALRSRRQGDRGLRSDALLRQASPDAVARPA